MGAQANQPGADVPEDVQASWLWSLKRFRTSMQPDDLLRTLITEPHFRTWLASLADRQAREEARDGGGWRTKPLKWRDCRHDYPDGSGSRLATASAPLVGSYAIYHTPKEGIYWVADGAFGYEMPSIEAAKAAAQADYEARIRSAIEPSPVEGDRR